MQRISKLNPTPENIQNFKTFRNSYNNLLRSSKKNYYDDLIHRTKGEPKKMWSALYESLNIKSNSARGVEKLEVNGESKTDNTEIANLFNEFFGSIGRNTLKDIDSTNCKPEDYLPPPSRNSLFIAPILAQEIVNTIKCIKGKVSTDINEVSTALLKSVAWQISAPLEHIFNLSIDQGFMPDNMKLSKTVPVFKKGGLPTNLTDYRGASMVNSFSKVFEKLMSVRLLELHFNNFFLC